MIEIVKYNDDGLQDNEIDEVITRVKAFIISSKNNMVVGYDEEEGFQLLGGYVNEGEDIVATLTKLIYEASGIQLDSKDTIEPFYEIRYYNRDYKGSGNNRLSDLIYFCVKSDKLPNLKKLKLSDREMIDRMSIEVVRRSAFGNELRNYIEQETNPVNKIKGKELQMAFEKFKDRYKQ